MERAAGCEVGAFVFEGNEVAYNILYAGGFFDGVSVGDHCGGGFGWRLFK